MAGGKQRSARRARAPSGKDEGDALPPEPAVDAKVAVECEDLGSRRHLAHPHRAGLMCPTRRGAAGLHAFDRALTVAGV